MSATGTADGMGPLSDGQTVAIIGGGPAGIACALTLKREAAHRGIALRVVVLEGKRFGRDYNQCAGVLSPPIAGLLENDFGVVLPPELCQREIQGYVFHSERAGITLSGPEYGGASMAVRRVEFDDYLERHALQQGVEIVQTRATDIEFRQGEVVIFTWGGTLRAAAVVGAFGLSRAMTATLARHTSYRPPRTLETVVTKVHPAGMGGGRIPDLLGNHIHVLLPSLPRVEFGALIPKGNHVAVIIAGDALRTDDMDGFLDLPPVREIVSGSPNPEEYFKGPFPIGLARGAIGNRYDTICDAAGLVRPFKGKGINSAITTGMLAAQTMMQEGVSAEAFRAFRRRCQDITGDMPYGRLVRALARLASHQFSMEPVVRLAGNDALLRDLLFDCVSGRETYRHIVLRKGNLRLAMRLGSALLLDRLRGRSPRT